MFCNKKVLSLILFKKNATNVVSSGAQGNEGGKKEISRLEPAYFLDGCARRRTGGFCLNKANERPRPCAILLPRRTEECHLPRGVCGRPGQ